MRVLACGDNSRLARRAKGRLLPLDPVQIQREVGKNHMEPSGLCPPPPPPPPPELAALVLAALVAVANRVRATVGEGRET